MTSTRRLCGEAFLRVLESPGSRGEEAGTLGRRSVQSQIVYSVGYFLWRSQQSISKTKAIKRSRARIQTSR